MKILVLNESEVFRVEEAMSLYLEHMTKADNPHPVSVVRVSEVRSLLRKLKNKKAGLTFPGPIMVTPLEVGTEEERQYAE